MDEAGGTAPGRRPAGARLAAVCDDDAAAARDGAAGVSGATDGDGPGIDTDDTLTGGVTGAGSRGSLAPGIHLVATPIGSAADITLRAIDVLARADVLAAEDTRTLRRLMAIHGIAIGGRPVLAYHDHNGPQMRPRLLGMAASGRSIAYASDAGTPLIADPGFALARDAADAGIALIAVPGASAVLAALAVAALPTDRFLFMGFLPPTSAARRAVLSEVAAVPATLVFYETARRCSGMISDCVSVLGDRKASLCRELTKKFEEVRRGTLSELLSGCDADPPRGEVVVVVDRGSATFRPGEMEDALRDALTRLSLKDAAREVAEALGLARRDVYQAALALHRDG